MFNEFDVDVRPGYGYDLDIAKGQDPYTNSGWSADDPSYNDRDIYRTSTASPDDHIQGIPQPVTSNNLNQVVLVDPSDQAEHCRTLNQEGGVVRLSQVTVGSKVCVRTRAGRWAMLTIRQAPPTRADNLSLHVAVLAD